MHYKLQKVTLKRNSKDQLLMKHVHQTTLESATVERYTGAIKLLCVSTWQGGFGESASTVAGLLYM